MISKFISQACQAGDALIIVPPFGGIDRPSLSAHILQACAKQKGFKVDVLYCNLLLAKCIGAKQYEYICFAPSTGLIGERFFSKAAYDIDAVSIYPNEYNTGNIRTSRDTNLEGFLEDYKESSKFAESWVAEVAESILLHKYPVVGCSTTFEQTSSSIALLNKLKTSCNSITTIIGGANCEDEMAQGIGTLSKSVDYIFSGESEESFPEFLQALTEGSTPKHRIIKGKTVSDMSKIPLINYQDYYSQSKLLGISKDDLSEVWLPYETSRGCWWGQKHHCLFCGINGEGMKFREKTAEQVINELDTLMAAHPTDRVCMVDNIMPHSYFKTLLPKLASKKVKYHYFYEQKANLKLNQVALLKEAGVNVIQPGIESLSTPLLKLMNKGITATQNINMLRYARMTDLFVNWNILHSFPGDSISWYTDTLSIVKQISHLYPPTGSYGLSIDRFSPYFDKSDSYSLTNVRPIHSYNEVFPKDSDISKIAYHFEADYPSDSRKNKKILDEIDQEMVSWMDAWTNTSPDPVLQINKLTEDVFLLIDSRINSDKKKQFIFLNKEKANACLFGKTANSNNTALSWAICEKYCIAQDEEVIPLATTTLKTYNSLKSELHQHSKKSLSDYHIKTQ